MNEFKKNLKVFERSVRIFEMTYLDLILKLKEDVKVQNLKVEPKYISQNININHQGQIIIEENQFFDNQANMIVTQSNIVQTHKICKENKKDGYS